MSHTIVKSADRPAKVTGGENWSRTGLFSRILPPYRPLSGADPASCAVPGVFPVVVADLGHIGAADYLRLSRSSITPFFESLRVGDSYEPSAGLMPEQFQRRRVDLVPGWQDRRIASSLRFSPVYFLRIWGPLLVVQFFLWMVFVSTLKSFHLPRRQVR